mmetsp:Transcript_40664/g.102943  ORF Transcript_40664/g.102943 Transcript_40664/m.102943 type:complete len:280 (-) Transcript_40664:338-1177(-)
MAVPRRQLCAPGLVRLVRRAAGRRWLQGGFGLRRLRRRAWLVLLVGRRGLLRVVLRRVGWRVLAAHGGRIGRRVVRVRGVAGGRQRKGAQAGDGRGTQHHRAQHAPVGAAVLRGAPVDHGGGPHAERHDAADDGAADAARAGAAARAAARGRAEAEGRGEEAKQGAKGGEARPDARVLVRGAAARAGEDLDELVDAVVEVVGARVEDVVHAHGVGGAVGRRRGGAQRDVAVVVHVHAGSGHAGDVEEPHHGVVCEVGGVGAEVVDAQLPIGLPRRLHRH